MIPTVKILGDKELIAWFAKLDMAVAEDTLIVAAKSGAEIVQTAAQTKAPRKTSTLARSIHVEVTKRSPQYVEVAIGTDLEYAAIHEFGGVIKPKNARFLAIPVSSAAKIAVSPGNFPDKLNFVPRSFGGMLVDRAGEAHFILKTSVTIPSHPYLRPALDENEDAVVKEMAEVLRSRLKKA
jgi:HK97 gp10 family phage protein